MCIRDRFSYSPHNFYTKKSSWSKFKNCIYFTFIVFSLLTVGFILGFFLATNKELQGLDIVVMDNILSSSDELLFDVTVTAFNPGFFAIDIQDVDLDIFAKSLYSKTDDKSNSETILLGTIQNLETPLTFQGGFFNRNYDVSRSSIKILDPGTDKAKRNPTGDGGKDNDEKLKIRGIFGGHGDNGDENEDDDLSLIHI